MPAPKVDWSTMPLGQMSDRKIAKLAGMPRRAVRQARAVRGIARYRGNPKPRPYLASARIIVLSDEVFNTIPTYKEWSCGGRQMKLMDICRLLDECMSNVKTAIKLLVERDVVQAIPRSNRTTIYLRPDE